MILGTSRGNTIRV